MKQLFSARVLPVLFMTIFLLYPGFRISDAAASVLLTCLQTGGIGSFDSTSDFNSWYRGDEGMGSFVLDETEKYSGASSLKVVVNEYSGWQVRMFNTSCKVNLEVGKSYQVEFWLKGEAGDDMALTLMDGDQDPSISFDVESAEWTHYSYLLSPGVDQAEGKIRFNYKSPGTYYIDEIVVTATDCNGDVGGTAEIDVCGICAGGLTGIVPGEYCDRTWISPDDPSIRYNGIAESEVNESRAVLRRFTEAYIQTGVGFGQSKARTQSGVSISFKTSSPVVALYFEPLPDSDQRTRNFAIFRDGEFYMDGISELEFEILNTAGESHDYELYLPIFSGVIFRGLELSEGEVLELPEPENMPGYVAIGNSITHGVGQSNGSHLTYPYHLADSLGYRLYNMGIGGSSINSNVISNVRALPDPPELISVLWGYNNTIFSSADLSTAMEDYDSLVCQLAREFPGARIVGILQTYTTSTTGNNPANSIERLRQEQLEILEQRRLEYANIHIIDGLELSGPDDLSDAVHLSDDGALNFAMGLIRELGRSTVFAPDGAEWYYGEGFAFSGDVDYMKFSSQGDTIILGEDCRVIQKSGQLVCLQRPSEEYLFCDEDRVYFWDALLEEFQLLYDFGARAGDHWTIRIPEQDLETYDSVLIRVDSVGYSSVNEHKMLTLHVQYELHFGDGIMSHPGVIMERIGDLHYMFNWYPYSALACDANYSEGLRCYEDEDTGLYSTGLAESCDAVHTDVEEQGEDELVLLYPNPGDGVFRIRVSVEQEYGMKVFDSRGSLILSERAGKVLDLSVYLPGLYHVRFEGRDGQLYMLKLLRL